jgi:hypothetical protein
MAVNWFVVRLDGEPTEEEKAKNLLNRRVPLPPIVRKEIRTKRINKSK